MGSWPLFVREDSPEHPAKDAWIERLTWAFVALGVALRVGRYAMNFPLWWDEAFVGVNFVRRGFLDLLQPLDYGQVCPLFFLWIELAAVKLLGFSEWSLRLFPMLCGVASVFLFRHVAGRLMGGGPRLLATALFAVSFFPIRHSADVKPYASDLLSALVLIALAFEWLRDSERSRWLWALVLAGPIAVGLSYPAIFVAAGVGLALFPSAIKKRVTRPAILAYGVATVATFFALFLVFTKGQAKATMPAMEAEWIASFPPWRSPLKLAGWLISTHTGDIFSYPFGALRAASTITFLLAAVAAYGLMKSHRKTAAAVCLLPFLMGMIAAGLRRYPYGGSAHGGSTRFMQYLAPSICLLAGLGASIVLGWIRSPARRVRLVRVGLVGLMAAGMVPVLLDLGHPYRSMHAKRSREFAREFWPRMGRDAELHSLRGEISVGDWDSIHLNTAVTLCNEAIYAPSRRQAVPTMTERFVLGDAHPEDEPRLASWLETMRVSRRLVDDRTILVPMGETGGRRIEERYRVFDFLPKQAASMTAGVRE